MPNHQNPGKAKPPAVPSHIVAKKAATSHGPAKGHPPIKDKPVTVTGHEKDIGHKEKPVLGIHHKLDIGKDKDKNNENTNGEKDKDHIKEKTKGGKDKDHIKEKTKGGKDKPSNAKKSDAEKKKTDKPDPKDKKPPPPKKVEEDLRGANGKRIFSRRLMNAMLPLRWFLTVFGHFPMDYREEKDGSYTFHFTWLHIRSILFILISFISCYALFIGGLNFAIIVLSSEVDPKDPNLNLDQAELFYETALLTRHLMWTMSMLAAVIHSVVVCFHLFSKRHYIPSIYTYHSKVSQHLHMDLSEGIFYTSLVLIGIYVSTLMAIFIMASLQFSPVTTGAPTLFGTFMFRLFVGRNNLWIDHSTATRKVMQALGGIFLIIIHTSSKCHMLMFVYHCKVLRNAFSSWNGRLYVTMKKGGKFNLTEEGRTTFEILYKDHTILLDLLEGTNRIYSTIIESYYALQMATIFFEIYFFLRTSKFGDNFHDASSDGGQYFVRQYDWLPGLFLTVQSVMLAFLTAKMASDVGEEAMAGVDITRRKTMLGRKSDAELLFQLSLLESYNSFQRFDIGAGGYDYLNKDWIMGYLNNLLGYFIILYQFQPVMDFSTEGDWQTRKTLGEFYTNLENVEPPDHWKSTPAPPPVTYI